MLDYLSHISNSKPVISLVLVLLLLATRTALVRLIRRESTLVSEQQRRWISYSKNGSFALFLILLILLWWPELRQFGLSIAAVALALVIASKELILCISGALLRATSGATAIGDWIEIEEVRGEVIEKHLLSTVLHEIELQANSYDYTGKTIVLPNSIFLAHTVKNMNFMRRFVFHSFSIVTQPNVDPFEIKPLLLKKVEQYCAEFSELGARYHAFIVQLSGMEIPSPEPSVRITTTNLAKNVFTVTLFCPTQQAVCLEQAITRDFYSLYYKMAESLCVPSGNGDE